MKKRRTEKSARSPGFTNYGIHHAGEPGTGPPGTVPGLVNGRGRINGTRGAINGCGMVNGRGLVNGQGMINGTRGLMFSKGLTNGNGLVNGSGFTNGLSLRKNRHGVVAQKDVKILAFALVAILVMVPMSGFLLGFFAPPPPAREGIFIDGSFGDWSKVPKYADGLPEGPSIPKMSLLEYAVNLSGDALSIYTKHFGPLFSEQSVDTVTVFIDADGNSSTGYSTSGSLGSDYMIELYGWNNTLQGSNFMVFTSADTLNFSAWQSVGGANAAAGQKELEVQVSTELMTDLNDRLRVLVQTRDGAGVEDSSNARPSVLFGELLVTQASAVQNSVITGSGKVAVLKFQALGSDVRVSEVELESSAGSVSEIGPFAVNAGETASIDVELDLSGVSPGTLVTVNLRSVTADRPVSFSGREAKGYYVSYPTAMMVDGLFNEWYADGALVDDPLADSPDKNVDISRYATVRDTTNAYFFLQVDGSMLAGTNLPHVRGIPPPPSSGGGPSPPPTVIAVPRVSGEDVMRMYVDADSHDSSGMPIGGIWADRMVEVRGVHGAITSRSFQRWIGWGWEQESALPDVETDDSRLEGSVPLSLLGALNDPRVVFHTTSWRASSDISEFNEGLKGDEATRSEDDLPIPLHGLNARTAYSYLLLNGAPTIDGNCGTIAGEYAGAYVITNPLDGFNISIGHLLGPQDYLYLCVEANYDNSQENGDSAAFYFDTDHQGENDPQMEDRYFVIMRSAGLYMLRQYRGNNDAGTPWVNCVLLCDAGNAGNASLVGGTRVHYEFKLGFGDVFGMQNPPNNRVTGFGFQGQDALDGDIKIWGSDDFNANSPATWGHLQFLPEFHEFLVPVIAAVVVPLVVLKRRKRNR